MATTAETSGPIDAPIAPPRVVRQRRMRPGLLGLAVLLVALGGLGAAFAVTSVRATGSYLAVARAVPVGTVLAADDLFVVQVAGGQGLAPIPADRVDEVIGKRAAVALAPGTLVAWEQLTDQPLIGPGQQQLSLGLKASEVPARQLHPGDKLLLIGRPARDAEGGGTSTRFEATVIDTATPEDGELVLYLALAERDVPAVVVLAGESRIAVVLKTAA
ncbi:SAF domain-containing protein [Micromonospora polyrhachis]|uniref:SAF domain-containing protein n=1 Tax=Micromonospora polyrhachis TaxID=1282883 RepID=UPI0035E46256